MSFWIFDTQEGKDWSKKNCAKKKKKTFNAKQNKQPVYNSNNQQAHNQI